MASRDSEKTLEWKHRNERRHKMEQRAWLKRASFFRFFGRLNSVYETVCVCVCEINQCSNLTIDRDSKTDMYNIK